MHIFQHIVNCFFRSSRHGNQTRYVVYNFIGFCFGIRLQQHVSVGTTKPKRVNSHITTIEVPVFVHNLQICVIYRKNCFLTTILLRMWIVITCNLPSNKAWMSGFGLAKWRFAGILPLSIEITILANEQRPEAGSEWPMFDLTEPINSGEVRSLVKKSAIELTSCGSPT